MNLSLSVHADILKMAKTKEKREAIKWFHARRVFFRVENFHDGLELARQSDHPDARFLVSLFADAPYQHPLACEEALAVFMARQDDPRCLCWAGCVLHGEDGEEDEAYERRRRHLFRMSSEGGCAWGRQLFSCLSKDRVQRLAMVEQLEMAVAQGEPDAMYCRGDCTWNENGGAEDIERAKKLWLQGAELGSPECQFEYAFWCCTDSPVEKFEWLRRAALQSETFARRLFKIARKDTVFLGGDCAGRLPYEIGCAVAVIMGHKFWTKASKSEKFPCERAFDLFKRCNEEAKHAVLCWLWIAKQHGIVKDIKLLIAGLIWEQRAAWSEKACD